MSTTYLWPRYTPWTFYSFVIVCGSALTYNSVHTSIENNDLRAWMVAGFVKRVKVKTAGAMMPDKLWKFIVSIPLGDRNTNMK